MNPKDTNPNLTLAQLAEGAAKELDALADAWDNHATPYSQSDMSAIILRHLSPEWERMVRENEELAERINELKASVVSAQCIEIDALRSENEKLRHLLTDYELDVDRVLRGEKCAMQVAVDEAKALRSENERLTKELAGAKEQWRMSSVCRELRAEVERLTMERDEALKHIKDSLGDAVEGCGMLESVALTVSQRDNAYNEASVFRARVRELEEDGKRLDWLAEQIGPGYAGGIVAVANLIPTHGGNLRTAIDKARKETP